MKLKPCPCCRSKAIFADLIVGKGSDKNRLWQVSCTVCGLSSELDEDKKYTAMRWNLRQEYTQLRVWITLLAALLPVSIVISLLLGNLMGISLVS